MVAWAAFQHKTERSESWQEVAHGQKKHPIGAERAVIGTWDWVSHTDETVSGVGVSPKLSGYIVDIETIPGLNGDKTTDCPTTLYDITLDDSYGYDLAGGALANRSASVAEKVVPSQPIPIDSEITISISAAGNAKRGRIILQIAPEV